MLNWKSQEGGLLKTLLVKARSLVSFPDTTQLECNGKRDIFLYSEKNKEKFINWTFKF